MWRICSMTLCLYGGSSAHGCTLGPGQSTGTNGGSVFQGSTPTSYSYAWCGTIGHPLLILYYYWGIMRTLTVLHHDNQCALIGEGLLEWHYVRVVELLQQSRLFKNYFMNRYCTSLRASSCSFCFIAWSWIFLAT